MQRTVTLTQRGREGRVTYTEGLRSITGSLEFGGPDFVALVAMGSTRQWRISHGWAIKRRGEVLRFIAEELIQQQSSACAAEVDEVSGDIVLRGLADGAPADMGADVSWMHRFSELRGRLGLLGLFAVLAFALGSWVKSCVVPD